MIIYEQRHRFSGEQNRKFILCVRNYFSFFVLKQEDGMGQRLINNVNGEFITLQQMCEMLNMGIVTARKISKEAGAAYKIGGSYRIDRQQLLKYIEKNCKNS